MIKTQRLEFGEVIIYLMFVPIRLLRKDETLKLEKSIKSYIGNINLLTILVDEDGEKFLNL